jgi:hypothetical protein
MMIVIYNKYPIDPIASKDGIQNFSIMSRAFGAEVIHF